MEFILIAKPKAILPTLRTGI